MRMCQKRITRLSNTFNLESPFKCIDKDILGENVNHQRVCQRRIRRLSDTFNLESPFKCIDKDILGEKNVSEKNQEGGYRILLT